MASYTLIENLGELVGAAQPDSITSRTFYRGEEMRAILFAFDTGQELSEHTASLPAVIHILSGEAAVTLGGDSHTLRAGAWIAMPPNLKHSVMAITPVTMLLLMLEN